MFTGEELLLVRLQVCSIRLFSSSQSEISKTALGLWLDLLFLSGNIKPTDPQGWRLWLRKTQPLSSDSGWLNPPFAELLLNNFHQNGNTHMHWNYYKNTQHTNSSPSTSFRIDQFIGPSSSAGAHLILSKPDNLSKPNPPNISEYIEEN